MSREAIDIAKNALVVLEEEHQMDVAPLRSILPSLALDFEKAGKNLSEKLLIDAVLYAEKHQIPLRQLFTQNRRAASHQPTFEEVSSRLNPNHFVKPDISRILEFGLVHKFEALDLIATMNDKNKIELVKHAAKNGHTHLCHLAIEHCENRSQAIGTAMRTGLESSQYHLVYETIQIMTDDEVGSITPDIQRTTSDLTHKSYQAFMKLFKDHRRSNEDIPSDALTGLEDWQNIGFRLTPYMAIREYLADEQPNIRKRNQTAFVAAMLLQTPERVLQFMDKWGMESTAPITHMMNQIDPPFTKHVKWHAWGDALIKFGPAVFYSVHFARQFPEPLRGPNGEISLRDTRNAIWNKCFPKDDAVKGVSELCYIWRVRSDVIPDATELWANRIKTDPHPSQRIPDVDMECTQYGLPGYKVKKLSHDDPRIMFLGYYTKCCEKIGDHFQETVQLSLKTRKHGYYVITQNDDIKAHSWAWRGERDQLVIDGWESKDPNIDSELLAILTENMAVRFADEDYDAYKITDVILSLSGANLTPQSHFPLAKDPAERIACEWYFEDDTQWLVKRIRNPGPVVKQQSRPGLTAA